MTDCNQLVLRFPECKSKKVQVSFDGGEVTSDGGLLLLRQADRALGLTRALARSLGERRRKRSCRHSQLSLLRQRIYAICQGHEDLNDHDELRTDPALQTAAERDGELASASTLCRWENRADREAALGMHEVLLEQFIASFDEPPQELILDFDATDDAVHGGQEGRFFHGYYYNYCFLPLYVFCGQRLLVAYLRPSKIDASRHSLAVLALLVRRLRQAWPGVRIIMRGDSSFCRRRIMSWCERNDVFYVLGAARNARLAALAQELTDEAAGQFADTGRKQRLFGEVRYGASTWGCERRVVVKAEHTDKGPNPRYVVTNLHAPPRQVYDGYYCPRGEMENRIKEQQLYLFADRTSCHRWWPNQFRLLLSAAAYLLMEAIRRLALPGTELARALVSSIRLKLLKVGGVVVRNTRRIRFHLSSSYPYKHLFIAVAQAFDSS
jgi:hypothetical protein